jgi:hypothetical protein
MCKVMPVILVNMVVDKKKNNLKKWRGLGTRGTKGCRPKDNIYKFMEPLWTQC